LTGVGVGNFISYRISHVDGVALQPHNLVGQLLGETGLVGGAAFLIFVVLILKTCRRIQQIFNEQDDILLQTFNEFSVACRNVIFLLFYLGLFGHNLLRFNWLWISALTSLAFHFASFRTHYLQASNVKDI
jgi:O-antigen ligase